MKCQNRMTYRQIRRYQAEGKQTQTLCYGWEFIPEVIDAFCEGKGTGIPVRLPHTVQELPLHYPDHHSYQMLCGYRRKLEVSEKLRGERRFLQFDGAAHIATLYINGQQVARHNTGYTAFRAEITNAVRYGQEKPDRRLSGYIITDTVMDTNVSVTVSLA